MEDIYDMRMEYPFDALVRVRHKRTGKIVYMNPHDDVLGESIWCQKNPYLMGGWYIHLMDLEEL